jgi:hypothetical protein
MLKVLKGFPIVKHNQMMLGELSLFFWVVLLSCTRE